MFRILLVIVNRRCKCKQAVVQSIASPLSEIILLEEFYLLGHEDMLSIESQPMFRKRRTLFPKIQLIFNELNSKVAQNK